VEAIGSILILTSIPLMLRWVPRNRFFGLRVPATLRSDSVWYDVNALCARHLFLLGVVLVVLEFVLPLSMRIPLLRVVATVGFVAIIVADWRMANRLERQRSASS
jgi:SdpI/YhfL family protein